MPCPGTHSHWPEGGNEPIDNSPPRDSCVLFSVPCWLYPCLFHALTRGFPPPRRRQTWNDGVRSFLASHVLLDLDRRVVITRLVQSLPSHRGSSDPSYAKSPFLEEDVYEEYGTKLRRETLVDNGRATGYLLRGTSCARLNLPLISGRSPAVLVCWFPLMENLLGRLYHTCIRRIYSNSRDLRDVCTRCS